MDREHVVREFEKDEQSDHETTGRRPLACAPLLATSSRWLWAGEFEVDQFGSFAADDVTTMPRDHIVVTTSRELSPHVRQHRCGEATEGPSIPGDSIVVPRGEVTSWDGLLPSHVRFALPPSLIDTAAAEVYRTRPGRVTITNVMRAADPVLAGLGELAVAELRTPDHPAQRLMVESLATAMAAHLLRGYTGLDEPRTSGPGLSPRGVHRALEYIRENPAAALSLDDLAIVAGLSRHHFARAFRDATGQTPVRYVERVRIDHAARLLRSTELPLAEVAAAVGYSDQSHFTRRFRVHTGMTPGQYRRKER
ncbi:helix-turn-helix domain-containing protein [Streptomyces fuscichromogenes]|uniref:helix-turn-helix domain-containing protein n=1 Tax=Streptomyces fuscichromogenes TaxID=1324013 RepID=UPI0016706714|nr:AraC family transcriptional regulator [Streptomyces fuscichromogenes]